jgi:hypothetical protein
MTSEVWRSCMEGATFYTVIVKVAELMVKVVFWKLSG